MGALHGMITAPVLFSIMNEVFGDVIYASLDTDKHKYPIGESTRFCEISDLKTSNLNSQLIHSETWEKSNLPLKI